MADRPCCKGMSLTDQPNFQLYANQFTKYEIAEFVEKDVDEFVISDDGPIMCAEVARAALQRSIAKMFYHAGFEEFQPSGIDAVTEIAADYFQKLGKTLMLYKESPQHERKFEPEVGEIGYILCLCGGLYSRLPNRK
jgi:transcriptional activator SPT7